MKKILALLLALVLTFGLFACAAQPDETFEVELLPVLTEPGQTQPAETVPVETEPVETDPPETEPLIDENGWYYSAEDVALLPMGKGLARRMARYTAHCRPIGTAEERNRK